MIHNTAIYQLSNGMTVFIRPAPVSAINALAQSGVDFKNLTQDNYYEAIPHIIDCLYQCVRPAEGGHLATETYDQWFESADLDKDHDEAKRTAQELAEEHGVEVTDELVQAVFAERLKAKTSKILFLDTLSYDELSVLFEKALKPKKRQSVLEILKRTAS